MRWSRERLVRRLVRAGFSRAEAEREADKIRRYAQEHPEEMNNPKFRLIVKPAKSEEEDPLSDKLFLLSLFMLGLVSLATLLDLLGRLFRKRKKREAVRWRI